MRRKLFVTGVLVAAALVLGYTVNAIFLRHSVTATGYLEPASVTQLNFSVTGPIMDLSVKPGDRVTKGEVLAKQDVTADQAKLNADEALLTADQAAVTEAENPLREPQVAQLQLQVAAAQAAVTAAQVKASDQASLDSSTIGADQLAATAAANVVASDRQQVSLAVAQCSSVGLTLPTVGAAAVPAPAGSPAPSAAFSGSPSISAISATATVGADKTTPPHSTTTRPKKPTTTVTTVPVVTVALPVINLPPASNSTPTITQPGTPTGAATTQAALLGACESLAHQTSTDEAALASAQGTLQVAQSTLQYDTGTLGAAVTVAGAQVDVARNNQTVGLLPGTAASVATAEAAVATDQATIANDNAALNQAVLVAPSDGIVGAVGGVVGDIGTPDGVRVFTGQSLPQQTTSGIQLFPQAPTQQPAGTTAYGSLITLDSWQSKVVAQVSETDLKTMENKRTATITLPALSGKSLTATVQRIEPQAENIGGKVYYLVDLAFPQAIPAAGDTATLVDKQAQLSSDLVGLTADVNF